MSAPRQLPSVVDVTSANPKPTAARIPSRVERFTAEQAQDPQTVAEQLTRLRKELAESTEHARTNPRSQSKVFRNIVVSTAGAKVYLPHRFNKSVLWQPVGWRGNGVTSGPTLVSDEADTTPLGDTNLLVLRSYVAGTVDIEIWPVP